MNAVFILGTAGSGKSLLTGALKEWLLGNGWNAIAVNMDPGVGDLPYDPDVDVRTVINVYDLMERYQLGPNGALVLAVDLLATRLASIVKEIEEYSPDYIIIDTPGQMELFVYRPSGAYIADHFPGTEKAILFIFDGWLVSDPINFLSVSLLASSVRLKFRLPFIPLLNKSDLIESDVQKILGWSSKPSLLEKTLTKFLDGENYLMYSGLFRFMRSRKLLEHPIPISAKTRAGFVTLSSAMSNVLTGGEEKPG